MAAVANNGFKSYSEKSKARRGLAAYGDLAIAAADDLIHLRDVGEGQMKWGFLVEQAEAARDGRDWVEDKEVQTTMQEEDTITADEKFGAAVNEAREENPTPVGNVFGGLIRDTSMPTVAGAATIAAQPRRAVRDVRYTIEKNRPEKNGVKRPSEGGICRQIWDAIDVQQSKDNEVPSLKTMKTVLSHLDMTTVSVQYYRWRKFNGVEGRLDSK